MIYFTENPKSNNSVFREIDSKFSCILSAACKSRFLVRLFGKARHLIPADFAANIPIGESSKAKASLGLVTFKAFSAFR